MNVPGHDPKELWQKHNGPKGWHAWTSDTWSRSSKYGMDFPRISVSARHVEVRRPSCAKSARALHNGLPGVSWKQSRPSTGRSLCNAGDHALATADTSGNSAAACGQTKDDSIAGWQNVYRADYCIGSKSLLDKNERWENSRSANEKHHPGRPYG